MTPFTNWLPTDCSLPPATTSHPSQRPSGARGPAGGLVLHQLHQPEAGLPQFPAGAARGLGLLRSHGHLHQDGPAECTSLVQSCALQVPECLGPVTSDFRGTDGGRRAGGKAIKSYFCVSHRDPQLHVIRSQESIGCALKGSKNLKPSRNLRPGRHVKFEQVIMDTTNQAPPQSNSSEIEKLK